jgi:hypothetical protein
MACMGLEYLLADPAGRHAHREEGLRLNRSLGDAWGVQFALWSLGQLHAQNGDLAAAETLCAESARVANTAGERVNASQISVVLALVAVRRGDAVTARSLLEHALRMFREFADQRSAGIALAHLGDVDLWLGDCEAARASYAEALSIFLDSGDSGMSCAGYLVHPCAVRLLDCKCDAGRQGLAWLVPAPSAVPFRRADRESAAATPDAGEQC